MKYDNSNSSLWKAITLNLLVAAPCTKLCFSYPPMAQQPPSGPGHPYCRRFTITDTPHSVGLLWTSDRQDAETSTSQHPHETHIQALGGIRTRNPSKRAWADAHLRLRLHSGPKRHNTTVRTDSRQGSRNQKHCCLCQRLNWNWYDWNVISPDCLAPTKWVCFRADSLVRYLLQCA